MPAPTFACRHCGGAMRTEMVRDWHEKNECLERPAPLAALQTFDEYYESETAS